MTTSSHYLHRSLSLVLSLSPLNASALLNSPANPQSLPFSEPSLRSPDHSLYMHARHSTQSALPSEYIRPAVLLRGVTSPRDSRAAVVATTGLQPGKINAR